MAGQPAGAQPPAAGRPPRAARPREPTRLDSRRSRARTRADPHERIDGLRAWLAQVDRKLGVRTYALGAALAVLAAGGRGIVALVPRPRLQHDAATKDDLQSLRGRASGVEQSAAQAAQEDVQSITDRLDRPREPGRPA